MTSKTFATYVSPTMEVISTTGRGPNTIYTVREGGKEWAVRGSSNLPPEVF